MVKIVYENDAGDNLSQIIIVDNVKEKIISERKNNKPFKQKEKSNVFYNYGGSGSNRIISWN